MGVVGLNKVAKGPGKRVLGEPGRGHRGEMCEHTKAKIDFVVKFCLERQKGFYYFFTYCHPSHSPTLPPPPRTTLALSHSFGFAWFPTFKIFSLDIQYRGTSAVTHAEGQRWEKSSAERWKEQSKLSKEDSWPESRWISRISLVRLS